MRIALNLGTVRGLGAGTVGQSILRAMLERGKDHEFIAWVPHLWSFDKESAPSGCELRTVGGGLGNKLLADQMRVPVELKRGKWDVLFSLNDTSTVGCARPHMLLLHQANLVAPPEHFDFPQSPAFRLRMAAMNNLFRACVRSVDVVTVQTQYMKQGLMDRWHLGEERIEVVPSAVDSTLSSRYSWSPDSLRAPYVFYPAMAYPYRNHVVLADMLSALGGRAPAVRCAVTVSEEEAPLLAARARQLGVIERLDFLGRVPPEEVHARMAGALAVVFPSKLESFGLPYVEAMAIGTPLIVADRPVAREVCDEGAIYCHPDDGGAFAEAVRLLSDNTGEARAASARGRSRFTSLAYSWEDAADRYLQILERL